MLDSPAVTTPELTVRPFVPGDEVALNDGFNRVFGRSRTLAEWSWKFPPEPGGRPIVVGLWDDDLVTCFPSIPVRFQVDGREWPATTIVDIYSRTADHPELAHRGLWIRTVREFYALYGESGRHPLMFGFPGARARALGLEHLGWEQLPLQPVVFLHRERGQPSSPRRLAYRAELARDWEPRLDTLWERVRHLYPVAAVRDSRWALRRLAGHPTTRYHRFLVFPRLSWEPVAFAAFRADTGVVSWVDLLWDRGHAGALELLAHLSARLAAGVGGVAEELWLNGDPEAVERLGRLGFIPGDEPRGLGLVGRGFDPGIDLEAFDGRVYLTMADCDLV